MSCWINFSTFPLEYQTSLEKSINLYHWLLTLAWNLSFSFRSKSSLRASLHLSPTVFVSFGSDICIYIFILANIFLSLLYHWLKLLLVAAFIGDIAAKNYLILAVHRSLGIAALKVLLIRIPLPICFTYPWASMNWITIINIDCYSAPLNVIQLLLGQTPRSVWICKLLKNVRKILDTTNRFEFFGLC